MKVEFVFFLTGFLIFIYRSIFIHTPLDIAYHDTYILLSPLSVTILFMILFAFLGLPYLILKRTGTPMYRIMGWIHYFLTMLPWFVIANFYAGENMDGNDSNNDDFVTITVVAALLFMAGQLIFFTNIILSLFKRRVDS